MQNKIFNFLFRFEYSPINEENIKVYGEGV